MTAKDETGRDVDAEADEMHCRHPRCRRRGKCRCKEGSQEEFWERRRRFIRSLRKHYAKAKKAPPDPAAERRERRRAGQRQREDPEAEALRAELAARLEKLARSPL